jgi:hypothetical protein
MKITKTHLRKLIREIARGPLVLSGGPGKRIPGYHYDRIHGVHVRNDYNPRTDYGDELDIAIQKLNDEELRNM